MEKLDVKYKGLRTKGEYTVTEPCTLTLTEDAEFPQIRVGNAILENCTVRQGQEVRIDASGVCLLVFASD